MDSQTIANMIVDSPAVVLRVENAKRLKDSLLSYASQLAECQRMATEYQGRIDEVQIEYAAAIAELKSIIVTSLTV